MYLNCKETAYRLGIGVQTFKARRSAGLVPKPVSQAKKWLKSDIDRFIDECHCDINLFNKGLKG